MQERIRTGAAWNLTLSTLAFAVTFAVWSLLSAVAPTLQKLFSLSDVQISVLIAIPVLLGSVGRVPMGMLTDRFGARAVFTALLLFSALAAALIPLATGFRLLVILGLLLGAAGTSFAVGVPHVSRWFPPDRQGLVLGIFGIGNAGTALVARLAPQLVAHGGWGMPFYVCAALTTLMAGLYWLTGRDAQAIGIVRSRGLKQRMQVLWQGWGTWVLSLYYFLTFGGFVALGLYLPKYLVDAFALSKVDAGSRAAGFVLLATLARPLGGWLADRLGGRRVLTGVFACAIAFAAVLGSLPTMLGATTGFLGLAFGLGLGNGAVFKLVAEVYPKETGVVTGVVGAAGGLGGFFPPLLLGLIKTLTGSYAIGFWLLALFTLLCLLVHLFASGTLQRRTGITSVGVGR